jgi:hypothetical protein
VTRRNPLFGWLPVAVLPCGVAAMFPQSWPRWALMWGLAFAIFCGCKWLTWWFRAAHQAPAWRHVAYLAAWPGLDADSFLDSRPLAASDRPAPHEWLRAAGITAAGLTLLYAAVRQATAVSAYLAGWVGMVGIIMALHFGSFHLLSCAWRAAGVDAHVVMDRPLASRRLSEFWGRRWNTAFRDLTHRFLFRPLTPRLGPRGAVLAGFGFSGLVHDAVISWPAQGGYGGPTLFFLLQAAGILLQRSPVGGRCGLRSALGGPLFTMGVLVLPVTLLFHKPFVMDVILPFLHAVGAI